MQIVPERTDKGEAPGVRGLIAHHAKTVAWVDDVVAVHQEGAAESGALGFSSWIFTQLSLPYKDPSPRGEVAWVRRNGAYTMVLTPAIDAGADGVRLAFPYGKYPRLILPWLTTEIVRRRGDMESSGALTIPIGESLRDFMRALGREWGGKSGKILREQARRLFRATIEFSQRGPDSAGGDRRERFRRVAIADAFELWWKDDEPEGQGALWGSEITVSPGFVASVLERPVPTDMRALRALSDRGGPLAMDIYLWLSRPVRQPGIEAAQVQADVHLEARCSRAGVPGRALRCGRQGPVVAPVGPGCGAGAPPGRLAPPVFVFPIPRARAAGARGVWDDGDGLPEGRENWGGAWWSRSGWQCQCVRFAPCGGGCVLWPLAPAPAGRARSLGGGGLDYEYTFIG